MFSYRETPKTEEGKRGRKEVGLKDKGGKKKGDPHSCVSDVPPFVLIHVGKGKGRGKGGG